MNWPEAFTTGVSYVCWTFIVWRAGAFIASRYID